MTIETPRPGVHRRGPRPRTTAEWHVHFERNHATLLPIPWHRGAEIDAAERAAIARSIRAFQLGESSDGAHLLRYAREDGERRGDALYLEVTGLFIAEEQRHAADLGRFMAANGIALARREWTDVVFRALRNALATLEGAIGVLVTAEILAKVYYRALYRATRSRVLRRICRQILRDERAHVIFQTQQLARLRAERGPAALALTHALQRTLFAAAMLVVWSSHARTLRRGGFPFGRYVRTSWAAFRQDLAAMDPRRAPSTGEARRTVRRIAWPASL